MLVTDNQTLRKLMSLPPIKPSASTALTIPTLPPKERVTGDRELDAVLWLRACIKTGHDPIIDNALKAAKEQLKSSAKELETRYGAYLINTGTPSFVVAFSTFGFADLEALASKTRDKRSSLHELRSRFGEHVYEPIESEQFCINSMARLMGKSEYVPELDPVDVDAQFSMWPTLMPYTIDDCLAELTYWDSLWKLRLCLDDYGDTLAEVSERRYFVMRCMGRIKPRNSGEALAVYAYLKDNDYLQWGDSDMVLRNLLGQASYH